MRQRGAAGKARAAKPAIVAKASIWLNLSPILSVGISGGFGSDWLVGGTGRNTFLLANEERAGDTDHIGDWGSAGGTWDFLQLRAGTQAATSFLQQGANVLVQVAQAGGTYGIDIAHASAADVQYHTSFV